MSATRLAAGAAAGVLAFGSGCAEICKSDVPSAVHMKMRPLERVDHFFDHPWPSAVRQREDGTLKLAGFPNPGESSTLEEYVEVIQTETRGFGRSAAIYATFSGPLDPMSLPADPVFAVAADATLSLIDVDAESPERGRRIPIHVRFQKEPTQYLPPNHLIALPPYGVPLRPSTTYALAGTREIRAEDGSRIEASPEIHNALRAECEPSADGPIFAALKPLRKFFEETGGVEAIEATTVATTFRTQDTIQEIRKLAEVARAQPVPAVEGLAKEPAEMGLERVAMIGGRIQMPGFQQGEVPYSKYGDGGAIAWDEYGQPKVDHHETVRVGFMIPAQQAMPARGWPVVLVADGTGSDYRSSYRTDVAGVLATYGIAVVSYDPTLHGPRDPTGSDVNLTFFNLFNIVAGRDNVRQGAMDCVVMTKLIRSGFEIPASVTGGAAARFDPDRVAFLGHSQGGLVGSLCAAVEPSFKAIVFSGTAGVLSITLQERKDPVDFAGLLRNLLKFSQGEVLDDMHPILSLVQTFIEPADPISYAPTYLAEPPGGVARDILHVEGFKDSASPARGHEAFATAARMPLISPFFRVPYAATLVGPSPQDAPVEGNVMGPAGPVTMGLIQYPEQDHWPIYDDADANARYVEFLRSALLDGRGKIIASRN